MYTLPNASPNKKQTKIGMQCYNSNNNQEENEVTN